MRIPVVLLLCAVAYGDPLPPGPVTSLPGVGPLRTKSYAGHVTVNDTCGAYLFFWVIESRGNPATDPMVMWLNGGPGSSSFLGALMENGPYQVYQNGSLYANPFGWNTNATYLMIDQPAGVGLSYVSQNECYAANEPLAIEQLHTGLEAIFTLYPQYLPLDFYVFGESYAGKYVPEIATRILYGPPAKLPTPIKLRGIGVGDGWVNPIVQQSTYGDYAYAHGLIDHASKIQVDKLYANCARAIRESLPIPSREADRTCNLIEDFIGNVSGGVNVYDVRSFEQYGFGGIFALLNQSAVLSELHVGPGTPPWQPESNQVAYNLELGEQGSAADLYTGILARIPVLLYNGVYDMDCNFMGTDLWIEGLAWPGQQQFNALQRQPWLDGNGNMLGSARNYGNLTQVLVNGAGHLVPMNQPAAALQMLETFLTHGSFTNNE